ncbi:MAG: glycine zipper domain-containing protein [Planctomycetota bacterium]
MFTSPPRTTRLSGRSRRLAAAATLASLTLASSVGCNNAGEGAISGAALGALGGLAIGSLTGSAGAGAAIGAVSGGIGGAVIGDQNERRDRRSRYHDDY